MKKYTFKSIGNKGICYLVNGWYKCGTIWFCEKYVLEYTEEAKKHFFNKPSQAKASLTRLLKTMDNHSIDEFELVEF